MWQPDKTAIQCFHQFLMQKRESTTIYCRHCRGSVAVGVHNRPST
ncbi:hypothetical protein OK016_08155 [Vibrio chagasii]|nr:hypothetical protein [Vibrio chagasii]